MKKLIEKILNLWFSFPQVLRFVLVGGFNTVFSFCIFTLLIYLKTTYLFALIVAYILGINCSILTMRFFVYQSKTNLLEAYIKGWAAYLSLFALNYVSLYILIEIFHISAVTAQALYTICSTIYIYLMHKYFTFNSNHK